MMSRVHLQCVIVGLALLGLSGCSFSRGSQISRNSEPVRTPTEEDSDEGPLQTASAEEAIATDTDAPPPQPGVKTAGGSRKKLSGWLSKGSGKSSAIPLDRTDKSKSAEDDGGAEEDSGWWKHQSSSATALNKSAEQSQEPEALSLSDTNPFDR